MAKAVKRGLERRVDEPIKYIGMDEKSFLKGQSYVTVMTDTEGKRILDIAQNRDTEAVDKLWGHSLGGTEGKCRSCKHAWTSGEPLLMEQKNMFLKQR